MAVWPDNGCATVRRPVPIRTAEKRIVELMDCRVLIAFAERLGAVDRVQRAGPLAEEMLVEHFDALGWIGLAAAADAAARASHDLDDVESCPVRPITLSSRDLGIGQSIGHPHVDRFVAHGHVRLPQPLDRPDLGEFQPIGGFAGLEADGRAERGFHHPAGGAEDVARAAGNAQRGVELAVGERGHGDPIALDHPDQFPRGEHGVGVRRAIGHAVLRPAGLVLLGDARHDRHHVDLSPGRGSSSWHSTS